MLVKSKHQSYMNIPEKYTDDSFIMCIKDKLSLQRNNII